MRPGPGLLSKRSDAAAAGHWSLGIHLAISHLAATSVGMKVCATAKVTANDSSRVRFRVEAHDEAELIGEGPTNASSSTSRFDKRVRRKASG